MDDIDRIRAFSRAYTGRLGLLGRSYLGSGLGMAEVRVLHDLDAADPVQPRALARALGLDEAQVSRILAGFVRRGWVERVAAADGRVRPVTLTAAGQARLADLRAASRAAVADATADLGTGGRAALARALDTAAALLSTPAKPPILRRLEPGDAGWVIERHGAIYARDEGYGPAFEALVAQILADFLLRADTVRERGWIATGAGGIRLGCVFCVAEGAQEPDVARLRLFLLEPEARGTGLGQAMMDACLGFARDAGYRRMRLWTHESHRAAVRLYVRNGFVMTASAPGRDFGQDVVDQTWERPLD